MKHLFTQWFDFKETLFFDILYCLKVREKAWRNKLQSHFI